jgi:hypothetical protein
MPDRLRTVFDLEGVDSRKTTSTGQDNFARTT